MKKKKRQSVNAVGPYHSKFQCVFSLLKNAVSQKNSHYAGGNTINEWATIL